MLTQRDYKNEVPWKYGSIFVFMTFSLCFDVNWYLLVAVTEVYGKYKEFAQNKASWLFSALSIK